MVPSFPSSIQQQCLSHVTLMLNHFLPLPQAQRNLWTVLGCRKQEKAVTQPKASTLNVSPVILCVIEQPAQAMLPLGHGRRIILKADVVGEYSSPLCLWPVRTFSLQHRVILVWQRQVGVAFPYLPHGTLHHVLGTCIT